MYKSALIMIATAAVAVTASARANSANEFGAIEEAKAMLKRAVVAVQQDKIAAINKFNYNDQQFRDRDLFVFCFNGKNGKYTAHEAMVGHDVRAFRDAKGQPVGQHMYESRLRVRLSASIICRRYLDRPNSRSSALI